MPCQIVMKDPKAITPEYKTRWSAGFDIAAVEDCVVLPHTTKLVRTGWGVDMAHDYELQIRPRSGMSISWPGYICNSPGTIDKDFKEEVKIIIHNFTNYPMEIKRGDRIAQGVVSKVYRAMGAVENDVYRSGGFGHTGR